VILIYYHKTCTHHLQWFRQVSLECTSPS